jgi:hypothetical protein
VEVSSSPSSGVTKGYRGDKALELKVGREESFWCAKEGEKLEKLTSKKKRKKIIY